MSWRCSEGDAVGVGRELSSVHLDQEINHCLSIDPSIKSPCPSHPNVLSLQPISGQIIQRRYRAVEGEYYSAA